MNKKFLIIIGLLLILAGAVWYFFFRAGNLSQSTGGVSMENLFPFGQGSTNNQGTTNNGGTSNNTSSGSNSNTNTQTNNPTTATSKLRQISTVPTSGIVAFDQGSTTLIRYNERATGHIYETISNRADTRKISVSTIPKIQETLWASDGSRLLVRYTKDENETIKTVSIKIATSSTPENAIQAIFLPDNIRTISILGNKIFYFEESTNGSTGMTANIDGSAKVSVYNSSFADWMAKWTSANVITLYSRPSGVDIGAAYTLNPTNGSYSKVAGNLAGLSAVGNTDGSLVLLSYTQNGLPKTAAYDTKSAQITELGVATLTDKCVWSTKEKNIVYCAATTLIPQALYPDDWYKGKTSFDDSLWRIDAKTGETQELINLSQESGKTFDAIDLGLNQSETALVFRNKNDLTAWRYEIIK